MPDATTTYYVITLLILGFPAAFVFMLSISSFLQRRFVGGVGWLFVSGILCLILLFKLANPNWSLLSRP